MTTAAPSTYIAEYLRDRLTPVEGAIPHLPGIDIYGECHPAETVGGDLFEYINFRRRYDLDGRISKALRLAEDLLTPEPEGAPGCSYADDFVYWFRAHPEYRMETELAYRYARSLESKRTAEHLRALKDTAGLLLVDAQGHGLISAKIASTVHDTFHALMLGELDRYGTATPELFENLNIRLARSIEARNTLGNTETGTSREIATMLYGEVHSSGQFRFLNFGHPAPLLFFAARNRFADIDRERLVQFLPLGLEVPEEHPDRKKYSSMHFRRSPADCSDVAEISLVDPGDILLLYTDGVYDGSDTQDRDVLEQLIRVNCYRSAKEICDAVLGYAEARDVGARDRGEEDLIDDKTVMVLKRTDTARS